jgi:hypothetical protein
LEVKEKHKESKEQAISWAAQRLNLLTKDPTKNNENGRWKCRVIKDLANEACKKFNVDERDESKLTQSGNNSIAASQITCNVDLIQF